VGDFNNDGKLDLAVASMRCDPAKDPRESCQEYTTAGQVSILIGDGTGKFEEFIESELRRSPFAVAESPSSIAVGDLDGDGNQDFVTTHPTVDKVTVRQGNGKVDFYREKSFLVGRGKAPSEAVIADLNGDGIEDLATANTVGDSVSILLGKLGREIRRGVPTKRWEADLSAEFKVGNGPQAIAVGDLNRDGNPDLATANADRDETVSILLGDGAGEFAVVHIPLGEGAKGLAIGDLNGDRVPDLIATHPGSDTLSILFGQGDGSFSAPRRFPGGVDPTDVAVADLDGDGDQDIAVISGSRSSLSILLNDGGGEFTLAESYPVGKVPQAIAVGDFNRDGKPDIAVANQGSNDVTVLLSG